MCSACSTGSVETSDRRAAPPATLPAAGVEQALAVDGRDRHVDDQQVLDELLAACDQLALGVERQRAPVEHQLVLPTDLVDVDERRVRVGGPRRQHPLAVRGLAAVVGRGVDVDGELGAAVGLHGERSVRAPDVLADADADLHAADDVQLERVGLVARREVAGLVEHRVVGQQALAVGAEHPAVGADRRGVEQVEVGVDEADDGRAAAGVRRPAAARAASVSATNAGLEHEILGRVAGDRQLGEGDDVAAGGLGLVVGVRASWRRCRRGHRRWG